MYPLWTRLFQMRSLVKGAIIFHTKFLYMKFALELLADFTGGLLFLLKNNLVDLPPDEISLVFIFNLETTLVNCFSDFARPSRSKEFVSLSPDLLVEAWVFLPVDFDSSWVSWSSTPMERRSLLQWELLRSYQLEYPLLMASQIRQ